MGYQYNEIGTMSGLSSAITEDKAYEIAVQNIDGGKPFLVVGEEPYVVSGYEDKGKTLLGEAYWQWGKKTTDWYNKGSLITLGEKQTPPPKIDILRSSLEWGIDLAEKPKRHPNGHDSGFAAYDSWITALKKDENFPKDNRKALSDNYTIHVEITLLNLLDSRTQAVLFLKSMADASGKGEKEIMSAVSDYEAEVILLKDMIKLALPEYPGKVDHSQASNQQREDNFAKKEVRIKMADLLLQAEDNDKQAVGHMKLALNEL